MEQDLREMLEMAARAAGYVHLTGWTDRVPSYTDPLHGSPALTTGDEWGECWNALVDDGDGARLEAALGIEVEWTSNWVNVGGPDIPGHNDWAIATEHYADHSGDKQAARRWATLRCAAAVGKAIRAGLAGDPK